MRNKMTTAATARRLLENARYEILPTASIEATVLEHVPVGHTVTVTASPKKGLDPTLALAERLTTAGYSAVPHLAARMISGKAELSEICDRLVAAGITAVFVPAGDQDPPAGDYHAALDLLEDLESLGRPFPHVGVTGYPESHPTIHDDVTVQAMWDKRRHATHIVSNLTFDAGSVVKWVERLRSRGVPQPVLVGLPGPVERTKLLTMATRIGVGESTRFLKKNKRVFAGIATPGGYDPMRFVERCARSFADPAMHVEGLHVFTFNQVAETEAWRREQLLRLGAPQPA
jgi:methylenetetrahydrofolate reductase (NADPH)